MPKFIAQEKECLAELVKQHPEVTSTGYSTEVLLKKKTSWEGILQAFNAQFPGKPPRDLPQSQGLWKRMRMVAKEKNDERRCEAKRTGGGPPASPPTALDNLLIEIIGDSQDPTNFAMDDDGVIEISDKLEDPTVSFHTPQADRRAKKRSRAETERSAIYDMSHEEHLEKMKLLKEKHSVELEKIKLMREKHSEELKQMGERHKIEILQLKREMLLKQINYDDAKNNVQSNK